MRGGTQGRFDAARLLLLGKPSRPAAPSGPRWRPVLPDHHARRAGGSVGCSRDSKCLQSIGERAFSDCKTEHPRNLGIQTFVFCRAGRVHSEGHKTTLAASAGVRIR